MPRKKYICILLHMEAYDRLCQMLQKLAVILVRSLHSYFTLLNFSFCGSLSKRESRAKAEPSSN